MEIEGYQYVVDLDIGEAFKVMLVIASKDYEVIIGNDDIWAYMTGKKEEQTDGRTKDQ